MILELASISFPFYSYHAFIRKPVSLLVQLEIGRNEELRDLAKNYPIWWHHLTLKRGWWVESLLELFYMRYDCFALQTKCQNIYMPAFQCLLIRVYKI